MFKSILNKKVLMTNKISKIKIAAFILLFFSTTLVSAQCAMCRAALGGDANKVQAEAVNDGIVYLMVIPYVLVALIGYAVYRMRKKKAQ
jgi:membrane protein DedA with SNARE-associated domain